jgi:wyosine [tRNA(Phe)-imidazoG37] synthetase (radical SAM superfamily)
MEERLKHVYGPVPSRRLGQSLGIDPIPLKTCNWNCVYCQLGRTQPLVNERLDYYPPEEILGETFYLPEVRRELSAADAVLPSLDAGTQQLYRTLNRPHPDVTFERLLEGLIAFRNEYDGKLWVEVMLVQGLNDTEGALRDIAAALRRVQPDAVHINLPTRPPVETWVQPPDEEGLLRAMAILGDIARVVHPVQGTFDLSDGKDPVDAVLRIITRHPMRQEELESTLEQWAPGEVGQILDELETSGRAQVIVRFGVRFWSAAPSHYPDETQSQRTAPGLYSERDEEV